METAGVLLPCCFNAVFIYVEKRVYTDFLQETLGFYYFAVDVYVLEAGRNLTLHLCLHPRLCWFFLFCFFLRAPVTTPLQGLTCLLKLANDNHRLNKAEIIIRATSAPFSKFFLVI